MCMDKESVTKQVVQAVAQVQEASGRVAGGIGPSTRPIGDARGFDSLNGVEVTVASSPLASLRETPFDIRCS